MTEEKPIVKPKKKGLVKKGKKGVEVVIKMKGLDGELITFEEGKDNVSESSKSEKENIDDIEKKKKAVKKKKSTKTVKEAKSDITSEQTLEMLMNVLKPKKTGLKKPKSKQSDLIEEDKESESKSDKPKPKAKKGTKTSKLTTKTKALDTMTKFVNNYGDTPHL